MGQIGAPERSRTSAFRLRRADAGSAGERMKWGPIGESNSALQRSKRRARPSAWGEMAGCWGGTADAEGQSDKVTPILSSRDQAYSEED